MSIIETYIAGISDKFGISRTKSVLFGGGLAALVSLLYATRGGLHFLDTVDYFINNFGVAALGLVEVVLIAWVLRKLKEFKDHANPISDIKLGAWWTISLGVITPLVLGFMMFGLLKENILRQFETDTGNYEGYADSFILYAGWGSAILVLVVGVILGLITWKNSKEVD